MPLATEAAVNLFVATTLATVVVVLVALGRRSVAGMYLCAFLALVAANFLFIGPALVGLADADVLHQLAFLLLAFDPVYLLLFVRAFPYERRSRAGDAVLALACASGLASAAAVVTNPETFGWSDALYRHPLRVLVVGHVVLVYAAAWFLAVHKSVAAPTRALGERAAWLVIAAGVALVPRVALLHVDLRLSPFYQYQSEPSLLAMLSRAAPDLLTFGAIAAGLVAAGSVMARRASLEHAPALRRAFVVVAVVLALLLLARLGEYLVPVLAPRLVSIRSAAYALRWIAFAVVLAYGILAYEVVAFRGAADRMLAGAAALVSGMGTVLAMLALSPAVSPLLALAVGAAVTAPAFLAARVGVRALEPQLGVRPGLARRLELYRASLETAWAQGPPDPSRRRRLERERRAFGVSYEEARALEHVVAAAVAPSRALAPGEEVVPGVEIERPLARGGQSEVHLARDHATGERVVVKLLRSAPGESAEARRRLLQELTAMRGLAHPHVVRLRDVHALPGRYALVLDHVDGPTLAEALRSGPLHPRRVGRIALDVLDALETVHRRGVVHRDVKPDNILLAPGGEALLADFGIAAALDPSPQKAPSTTVTSITQMEGVSGTLRYMAPEQAAGARATAATDLYQLALSLIEALTGGPALEVEGLGTFDALSLVARPRVALDGAPSSWRPILARALDPEPARRYARAEEMRADVLALAQTHGGVLTGDAGTQDSSGRSSGRRPDAGDEAS